MGRCPGTEHRLPGELELADQYGVSRDTIRRAIQELVSEGRLLVLHGRGTFVTPKGHGRSKIVLGLNHDS
jgi:GntR family transcriptional regulator